MAKEYIVLLIYRGMHYKLDVNVANQSYYLEKDDECWRLGARSETRILASGAMLRVYEDVPKELHEVTKLWIANNLGLGWSEFVHQTLKQ